MKWITAVLFFLLISIAVSGEETMSTWDIDVIITLSSITCMVVLLMFVSLYVKFAPLLSLSVHNNFGVVIIVLVLIFAALFSTIAALLIAGHSVFSVAASVCVYLAGVVFLVGAKHSFYLFSFLHVLLMSIVLFSLI